MKVDKYTQIRMKMIEKKIYWKDITDRIGYSNWGLRLAIKNNKWLLIFLCKSHCVNARIFFKKQKQNSKEK